MKQWISGSIFPKSKMFGHHVKRIFLQEVQLLLNQKPKCKIKMYDKTQPQVQLNYRKLFVLLEWSLNKMTNWSS